MSHSLPVAYWFGARILVSGVVAVAPAFLVVRLNLCAGGRRPGQVSVAAGDGAHGCQHACQRACVHGCQRACAHGCPRACLHEDLACKHKHMITELAVTVHIILSATPCALTIG